MTLQMEEINERKCLYKGSTYPSSNVYFTSLTIKVFFPV